MTDLYDPRGRYGDVRWTAVALLVVGTVLGWGLVTNTTTDILTWQGYLLGPVGLGGRDAAARITERWADRASPPATPPPPRRIRSNPAASSDEQPPLV